MCCTGLAAPQTHRIANIHPHSVDFLDTTRDLISNVQGNYKTKIFFKATDTHALLHKSSYHSKHTFMGIVKSQLFPFHRIWSRWEDFQEATRVLFSVLSTRGYSCSFLRKAYKHFQNTRPATEISSLLPFVLDYSISALKLVRTIRKNLHKETQHAGILQNYRLIVAYRRRKNLQDFLWQPDCQPWQSSSPGHNQIFSYSTDGFTTDTNQIFRIQQNTRLSVKTIVFI